MVNLLLLRSNVSLLETKMSSRRVVKYAEDAEDYLYCLFVLSRGVYNLKKHTLAEYPGIVTDFTRPESYPDWMEPDTVYLFKRKNISEDVDSLVTPYTKIYLIADCLDIELIEADKFIIKVEYESYTDILVFQNIIEAWKFYNYVKILILNFRETRQSMYNDIKLNMRILLDDYRFEQMDNIIMILLAKYNAEYVKSIYEKTKIALDENEVNFPALNKFIQLFIAAYYSDSAFSTSYNKLRCFINNLHDIYLKFVLETLSNPFTEVTLLVKVDRRVYDKH